MNDKILNCGTCKYMAVINLDANRNECRRDPRRAGFGWPGVIMEEWCGEYLPGTDKFTYRPESADD